MYLVTVMWTGRGHQKTQMCMGQSPLSLSLLVHILTFKSKYLQVTDSREVKINKKKLNHTISGSLKWPGPAAGISVSWISL